MAEQLCKLEKSDLEAYILNGTKHSARMWNSILSAVGDVDWERGRDILRLCSQGQRHQKGPASSGRARAWPILNTIHYNALITAAGRGKPSACRALQIFQDLEQADLQPTFVTHMVLISAIARAGSWADTKKALDICATWRRAVRQNKEDAGSRKTELYNVELKACSQFGRWDEAQNIWKEMCYLGIPCDKISYATLLRTATAARVKASVIQGIWDSVQGSHLLPDASLYDAMLQACVPSRDHAMSIRIWCEMSRHGLTRRASSFAAVALMRACETGEHLARVDELLAEREVPRSSDEVIARLVLYGDLAEKGDRHQLPSGWRLLEEAKSEGVADARVYNTLIALCGKDNALDHAFKVFDELANTSGLEVTHASYRSLLAACQRCGDTERALSVFESMQQAGYR